MKTDSFSREKHLPVRRFIADESKVATGLYGPMAIAEDLDNLSLMFDPEAEILAGEQKGGISGKNIQENAIEERHLSEEVRMILSEKATETEVEIIQEKLDALPEWAKQPNKPKYTADEVEIADGVPIREEFSSINRHLNDVDSALDDRVNYGTFHSEVPLLAGRVVQEEDFSEKFEINKKRNTIIGAIAENRNNISLIEKELDSTATKEEVNQKLSETILHHYVVDTPVWSIQPTVDGELLSDFKTTDFYYVTQKNTDGTALPTGQFKLMPYVDKYAEAYEQIFYRSTVPSENFPVEFKEIGANFKMRDAGRASVSFNIGKKFKDINRLELSAVGHYIQQRSGADYFAPYFSMSQKCRSYSSSTATWDYDSNTMIWHYASLNGTGYKANWFRDSFYLQKNATNTFTSSRKCSLRCVAYGGNTAEKKGCNTVGYGWVPSEDTIVYSVNLTTIGTSGFIRNGTEITVKEVK